MSIGLAFALVTAQAPTQAAPPATDETVTYVVRAGDTFERLSRDYLVRERNWQALLRLAGINDPRRLPVGRKLVIPRSWLRYAVEPARLASYRGNVEISIGGRRIAAATGLSLGEGVQLTTGANSFISLALADSSTVVIPSQSRIVVRRLRRILLTGTVDYRIEIERGRLENRVQPLDGAGGRYQIQTPLSMTAVRGTDFRVTYDPGALVAGTEVLSGTVSFAGASEGGGTTLEGGIGAAVDRAGASLVVDLLPAPELRDPGKVQTGDRVEFQAHSLPGAIRYRTVIASDAGFIENLAEQIADDGTFGFADIPNGNLFVRVSAIDGNGLEGLAQSYSFRRRLASIRGEVEAGEDGYRFRWSGSGDGKRYYRFQLMRGASDTVPIMDEVALADDTLTLRRLPQGVYFWRVGLTQVTDGEIVESWTDFERLTIAEPPAGRS